MVVVLLEVVVVLLLELAVVALDAEGVLGGVELTGGTARAPSRRMGGDAVMFCTTTTPATAPAPTSTTKPTPSSPRATARAIS